MKLNMMVAVGQNGEIGKDNKLLWSKQFADMMLFKKMTLGKAGSGADAVPTNAVVMGLNTWDSIPSKYKPLPGRINIVLTSKFTAIQGARVAVSIDDAIEIANDLGMEELWFVGGSRVYKEVMSICDQVVITRIHKDFPDADTHFEESLNMPENGFVTLTTESFVSDERNEFDYTFETWVKKA